MTNETFDQYIERKKLEAIDLEYYMTVERAGDDINIQIRGKSGIPEFSFNYMTEADAKIALEAWSAGVWMASSSEDRELFFLRQKVRRLQAKIESFQ